MFVVVAVWLVCGSTKKQTKQQKQTTTGWLSNPNSKHCLDLTDQNNWLADQNNWLAWCDRVVDVEACFPG